MTTLRCIYIMRKKTIQNIMIGLNLVSNMEITKANGKVNLMIRTSGEKTHFEIALYVTGDVCPSSFETAVRTFRFACALTTIKF